MATNILGTQAVHYVQYTVKVRRRRLLPGPHTPAQNTGHARQNQRYEMQVEQTGLQHRQNQRDEMQVEQTGLQHLFGAAPALL